MNKLLARFMAACLAAACFAAACFALSAPAQVQPATATDRIVRCAEAFLSSLTPDQRRQVLYAFDDQTQRARWSNFPTGVVRRGGISLRQMSPAQREAAMQLLAAVLRGSEFFERVRAARQKAADLGAKRSHSSGYDEHLQRRAGVFWRDERAWAKDSEPLSPAGLQKVNEIRQADDDFKANGSKRGPPGNGGNGGNGGPARGGPGGPSASAGAGGRPAFSSDDLFGSDLYYLSILGEPSATQPWLLQFGGHHLALNITIAGSQGLLTPSLTGAQPAVFTLNGNTVRPLGRESDKALALLQSLSGAQRQRAVLGYSVADLVLGPGQDGKTIVPDGLKAADMDAAQQALLLDVIAEWSGIVNAPAAAVRMQQLRNDLRDTWFAWSGPTTGKAGDNITAYYRIQGPHLVIEYAPQSDEPGNHVHTIYRDPTNDYGRALAKP